MKNTGRTGRLAVLAATVFLLLFPAKANALRWDYKISIPVSVTNLHPDADYISVNCAPHGVDTLFGMRDRPQANLDGSKSFSGVLLFRHELPNPEESANLTTFNCFMEICDNDAPNGGERCALPEPGGSEYNGVGNTPPPVFEYSGSFP